VIALLEAQAIGDLWQRAYNGRDGAGCCGAC
jgi:hypothetical protein